MNNGRFQILLRRRQNRYTFADATSEVNVVVQCNPSTGYAEYVAGNVDNTTPFESVTPVGGWYDFGDFIEPDGINNLSFTWDKVNSGDSSNVSTSQDGSNYDKGITSDLTFFDDSYKFIYDWLLKTECSILNSVEVKIIDLIAGGTYRLFEIKSDNLDYAPIDDPCKLHVKLREQDNNWHCIHKTFIWDNWQHWFENSPIKEHPCFLTCIEPRPRLVQSARMALMVLYHSSLPVTVVDWITGNAIKNDAGKILNANRFVDAPLIRTYIENVAGKCGLTMDTIFDTGQPWENLCLYFPQAGYMHEIETDEQFEDIVSPSLAFHFDNRWNITFAELLDKLKVVFAAEWYVTPLNKIVFKHKKDLILLAPIYDFTAVGAEPIYNLRYSFNGEKKPAYGRYEYATDGSDLASQEVSTLYNDIIDYDGTANNPMLEGDRVKNFEFAPTGFVRDGRAKDYIELLIRDGRLGATILLIIIAVVVAALLAGTLSAIAGGLLLIAFTLWLGEINKKSNTLINEFVKDPIFTGAVRLTSEQTLAPRLILWDGLTEQRAKAVATIGLPVPNLYYNPGGVKYDIKNKVDQDNPAHTVYNYPMYFDGDFWGNLFPRYHDIIDNPLKSLETHQDVKWNVDLCEGMLNLFGVFQNQYAQIGKIVKLEHRDGYDVYVRIGNINVDYNNGVINLAGTVLRRRVVQFEPEPVPNPGPGGGGELIDVFPPGGDFPEGDTPIGDTGELLPVCLKWINSGTETAEQVQYVDCNNVLIIANIAVGETFCSVGIISEGTGGNITATDRCDEESPSGGSSLIACYTFQNLTPKIAVVTYVDCEGNLVENATIIGMGHFCAREIISQSECANLINMGSCDCEESGTIFPVRDSDDTMIIDSDGTIVIWQ